eukprot:TRINITY_DN15837_c0_g1_i1.p1 TRINITY_DN15837_c0_g1~~TRINITY_DN15837_c0_g1_i1.p1  ORF type:complete len:525 (+),score=136.14 TRINITY_DN15837_c0_g1_i1:78-1577(+)
MNHDTNTKGGLINRTHLKNQAIKIKDLQNFLLWATGFPGKGNKKPKWININFPPPVTVVLFVRGLTTSLITKHKSILSSLDIFDALPFKAPGTPTKIYPTHEAILQLPEKKNRKSEKKKRKREQARNKEQEKEESDYDDDPKDFSSLEKLILSASQLAVNFYPNHVDNANYKTLPPPKDPSPKSVRIFSIDCEMCQTLDNKRELLRVTLIDEDLKVIYDTLVKPAHPVIDFRSNITGITEADLESITTTLADVQEKISTILDSSSILAGHSLNYDLHSLQLIHTRVLDTSLLYSNPFTPSKHSLKDLASKFLNKIIQVNKHDSIEDAVTAMELCLLRKNYSPEGPRPTLLQQLYQTTGHQATVIGLRYFGIKGVDCILHENSPCLEDLEENTFAAVVKSLGGSSKVPKLICAELTKLWERSIQKDEADCEEVMKSLNGRLDRWIKSLPAGGAALVIPSFPLMMNPDRHPWLTGQEVLPEAWKKYLAGIRAGTSFLYVKE